jgi:hypothetical protein
MAALNSNDSKILVENINVPGYSHRVDANRYQAMHAAMLKILPDHEPGLTQPEIRLAALSHLPEDLFPGGKKAGWWAKTVQLDLEAKGVLVRELTKPLRWHIQKDTT